MQRRSIEQWLHDAIEQEGYRRFDDLHIDEIDPRYEDRSLWLRGIVLALNRAAAIRDSRAWPFTLAGAMGLKASTAAEGVMVASQEDIVDQFDDAPPSLYAFPKGAEPWVTERHLFIEIPTTVVAAEDISCCFFGETFDERDQEYRRTIWITR